MKNVILCMALAVTMMVSEAQAGGFGFTNFTVSGVNKVQVNNVSRFGRFGLRRNVTRVSSNGFNTNVQSFNTGPLGLLRFNRSNVNVFNGGGATVAVNANGFRRFNGNNVLVVNGGFPTVAVNGFRVNNGFHGNNILLVNGGVPTVAINGFRVNAFGTRTVVDGVGNVFEVDAFGNSRFRGNATGRGFSSFGFSNSFNNGFTTVSTAPVVISSGVQFRSFGSCGLH